ncbi:hypothetical protein OG216_17310 [Streptomycetaceae bacterium NBC_01309]
MIRNRVAMLAASTVAGALLLTACGSDSDDKSAASGAAPGAVSGATTPDAAGAPADAAGAGVGELLFKTGSAKDNNATPKTGDWANEPGKPATSPESRKWVQLTASRAGQLNPVVVNGSGFTLYRFDKDTAKPSKSNCNGECATTWPPVLVAPGSKIFVEGVPKSKVGVVKRDDGTHQVTIGGWPVYRFSKDLKAGDTNGQGVGGTWFGVRPDGGKAGAPANGGGQTATPAPAPSTGNGQGTPASSVVLFDDKDFADNGAQGLAGPGCQNVFRDNVASSMSANGTVKLWSDKNCKGTSKVVDGDVADLGTIGLDNNVSSVAFG